MSVWAGLRIDEVARTSGVTARNVRAYQSLGLLPAPRLVGRVGWYDDGHLRRLRAIGRLQTRGFSLAAIKGLFDAYDGGETLGAVLGLDPTVELDRPTGPPADQLPQLALVPGPWVPQLLPSPPTGPGAN
jgi:DNA-binding transcriptional MerR regulator